MAAIGGEVRRTKADRTRARILDAAAEVFAAKGYSGAGLRDIAAAANLRAGSLYYHFASREDLVAEVLRAGQDLISDAVTERIAGLPAGANDLVRARAMISAHAESLAARGNYTAAAIRLLGTVPAQIHQRQLDDARAYDDLWRTVLTAAQESGRVRANVDPSAMRMFILGALNSIPDWYHSERGGLSGADLATGFTAVFLDGIATRRRPRRHAAVSAVGPPPGGPDVGQAGAGRPAAGAPGSAAFPQSRGAATQARILDSAAHAFREKGFHDTAFADIAEAVGLQRESLYYHFTSLDELADQLLRDAWKRTTDLVRQSVEALPDGATHLDRLATAMTAHLLALIGEGGYTAGLVHVLVQVPAEVRQHSLEYQRSYVRYWRRLAQDAQDAGQIRSDVNVPLMTLIVINALNWSVEWYKPGGRLSPEALADQFLSMALDGLATTRPRPRRSPPSSIPPGDSENYAP
jgi:AcrR family transcriptional regulator